MYVYYLLFNFSEYIEIVPINQSAHQLYIPMSIYLAN